jgi:type I restriction enzyme S subunit
VTEYERYSEYKNSGVEWLGEIPSDWQIRRLSTFIEKSNAGEVIDRSHWYAGSELLYTCSKEPMVSSFTGFPDKKRTLPNDLLLTRNATPYVHIPESGSIYSNVVQRVSIKSDFDRRWLAHAVSAAQSNMVGYGVSIPSLSYPMWAKLIVPTPPNTGTQQKIVEFLDRETAHIDAGVANMESLIALLTEKRAALISETVTRGIPGEHTAYKDSGVEWLGEIPVEWALVRAKTILDFKKRLNKGMANSNLLSLSYGKLKKKDINSADGLLPDNFEGYQIIHRNEFVFRFTDLQNDQRSLRSAISKLDTGIITSAYLVAAVKNDKITNPDFFAYLMRGYDHKKVFYGIGSGLRQSVGTKEMSVLPVPLPSLEMQQKIVEFLDKETSQIDLAIDNAKSLIQLMKEKRQTLISDVVTGKIDVTNYTD